MGFIPCVDQQDPFTRKVRATYRANVVRAPRTGILPLDALAVRKTVVQPRGRLAVMIDGEPVELPKSHQDKVAALSGELSTAVDLGLGIDLTAKFFTALGIPIPSAQASATLWQNAHQIRFEVLDVVQHQVDVSELGLAVNGRRIARNPATDVFFSDEKTQLLVITRTLTSSRFAVHAVDKAGQSVNIKLDALADIFGKAQANVSWSAEGSSAVSFQGKRAATFAFAAVPCAIAADGTFVFGLESSEATLGAGPPPEPEMKPVIDQPGLLTFDPSDERAGNPFLSA